MKDFHKLLSWDFLDFAFIECAKIYCKPSSEGKSDSEYRSDLYFAILGIGEL